MNELFLSYIYISVGVDGGGDGRGHPTCHLSTILRS